MASKFLIVIIFVCQLRISECDHAEISEFLTNYGRVTSNLLSETSSDDSDTNRRGAFEIRGYGQHFQIAYRSARLHSLFAPGAKIVLADDRGRNIAEIPLEEVTARFVDGRVVGQPGSSVFGTWYAGTFAGHIRVGPELYYVEDARRLLGPDVPFDSVMYRRSDVRMATSGYDADDAIDSLKLPVAPNQGDQNRHMEAGPHFLKVKDGPNSTVFIAERPREVIGNCTMMLVVDKLLQSNIFDDDGQAALHEVIYHIKMADNIYRSTDFNGDGRADNVGLQIGGSIIETQPWSLPSENDTVPSLMAAMSKRYNFDNVCLGFIFTGRVMNKGITLGASYIAEPVPGHPTGVCGRYKPVADEGPHAFNCGLITFQTYNGTKVPRGRSILTVAHEIGHSFGASHDDEALVIERYGRQCTSDNEDEHFLMTSYRANKDNFTKDNHEFSWCSRQDIQQVLAVKGGCIFGGGEPGPHFRNCWIVLTLPIIIGLMV